MEHKSWPWKKKSTEKTMISADKVNKGNEDELQAILADKAEMERSFKIANEKLTAAVAEIHVKDDIAKKQTNIAREAIQGWEKAETEVLALKQELEKATQQRVADDERLYGVDAALKECMQQLRFVREEQEKRIRDAVMNTSREYEKARIILEEKLAESTKRLAKLSSENTQMNKALLAKENMIDELNTVRAQVDSDLSDVISRLESTQRENASLSYEVRVLEKELEIRNEERDFNRQTAEVAHKQHLESVKKIARLETEAQRLRLLVQKRLPGPAALAKMKNEVELLGRSQTETARRKSNPFPIASKDFSDVTGRRINFLTEQLCALEEENRVLKEFLNRNTNEFSKSQTATGPARNLISSHEFFMAASSSDIGSDEKVSMAESWAPSSRTVGASDIGLMDDFVEMEKLALVSVDKLFESSNLVSKDHSVWLDNILKVISEHAKTMQTCSSDVLEEIKVALGGKANDNLNKSIDKKDANGYITEESQTPEKSKLSNEQFRSNMHDSVQRLIQLIEGVRLCEKDDSVSPYKTLDTPTGYTVRVLQWKTSELSAVLETFLQSCTNLLDGKAYVEDFAKELTSALEWIVNHCFSLQDVSSMRYEIKKHLDWDETHSEIEVESAKMDLESKLQVEICKSESLVIQLEESEKTIGSLQTEVETLKEEKGIIEDQIEVDIMVKEDLDEQLIKAIGEYNEAHQRSTSVEELGCNSNSSNEEVAATNLDEHPLPENVIKDDQNFDLGDDERRLRSEQEITIASEKLAECQETILNLGKQLKALASPKHTSRSDKLICNPAYEITTLPLPEKSNNQRISLLDKMMAEDATGALRSPKKKEVTRVLTSPAILDGNLNAVISPQRFVSVDGIKRQEDEEALVDFLSIVPNKKKKNGGMLRKLFWRRKKK